MGKTIAPTFTDTRCGSDVPANQITKGTTFRWQAEQLPDSRTATKIFDIVIKEVSILLNGTPIPNRREPGKGRINQEAEFKIHQQKKEILMKTEGFRVLTRNHFCRKLGIQYNQY